MARTVSWFSCGAASAVATKLVRPDVIAYCDTGSEDGDNARFMADCERWFQQPVTHLSAAPARLDRLAVLHSRAEGSGAPGRHQRRSIVSGTDIRHMGRCLYQRRNK